MSELSARPAGQPRSAAPPCSRARGARPGAPLARASPTAKLAVSLILSLTLVATTDHVTAGVALAFEVALLPLVGLSAAALARRLRLLLLAAVPPALVTMAFGVDDGALLLALGPLTVTEGSLLSGVSLLLRLLAIGLPGLVLLATTDPTDLADSLAQDLRLPARFVLGALAAVRLLDVLFEEWTALRLARRARGLESSHWHRRLAVLPGLVFALFVLALRRATTLATAMEARGFGAAANRTWARPTRFGAGDWLATAGGVAVAAVATAAGLLAGTWDPLLLG